MSVGCHKQAIGMRRRGKRLIRQPMLPAHHILFGHLQVMSLNFVIHSALLTDLEQVSELLHIMRRPRQNRRKGGDAIATIQVCPFSSDLLLEVEILKRLVLPNHSASLLMRQPFPLSTRSKSASHQRGTPILMIKCFRPTLTPRLKHLLLSAPRHELDSFNSDTTELRER
jgi:hypothetical protein